jgi:hypothetical protein
MWSLRTRGPWRDVLHPRFGKGLVAVTAAQGSWRVQVNFPAQDFAKRIFHGEELQPGNVPGLKFDQDVNVAPSHDVVSKHKAEENQFADMLLPTKVVNLFLWYVDSSAAHDSLP